MQRLIFLLLLSVSFAGQAACPLADSFFKQGKPGAAVSFLQNCAINYNDDESQMKLAKIFTKGDYGVARDSRQALYYFQLAAETGNADAQLALAQLLMKSDERPETRDALLDYRSKLEPTATEPKKNSFKGDFMHPYALLMLASESPDKKWYYPSQVRNAPAKAQTLFKTYHIDDDKKRAAMRQASQFKTRKLLQLAEEVYPPEGYTNMEERLKNPKTQKEALNELKQRMEEYIQSKKVPQKAK